MLTNKGSRHPAGAFALLLVLMGQGGQVVEFPLLGIELSVADTALGLDLAHGQQGALGQGGSHQLIDQHRKQHHIPGKGTVGQGGGGQRHAQCHTRLWHQGCADSSKRVGQYMDLLKAMIGALRTDLGVSDLPVVVGELPYWRSTSAQFNEMIRTVSDHIPNTACVSAEGCGMRADADDPHFSREGLNILGKRYAEEMKKLINK